MEDILDELTPTPEKKRGKGLAVVPSEWAGGGGTIWGSIQTYIPWYHYWLSGDIRPMEKIYPYVYNRLKPASFKLKGNVAGHGKWGDWQSPKGMNDNMYAGHVYNYVNYWLLLKMAKALNKTDDIAVLEPLVKKLKEGFNAEYYKNGGYGEFQLHHSLALQFDLAQGEKTKLYA